MSSEDYAKIQELLTNRDILNFARRLCAKHGFDPVADYPQTAGSPVMKSAARKQLYLNQGISLLRRAIFLRATRAEALIIAGYLLVLSESIDKKLDYERYKSEMGILGLLSKYSQDELLNLDICEEDIRHVMKSDERYYGVSFKEATT